MLAPTSADTRRFAGAAVSRHQRALQHHFTHSQDGDRGPSRQDSIVILEGHDFLTLELDLERAPTPSVVGVTEEVDFPGLTVAQMAAATGVSAYTLRYYERAGLIQPVARNLGNQRRYSESDIEWLQFLLRLRETGMAIARMREYAELRAEGMATIEARLALLEEHQAWLHEQIALLRNHAAALEAKIATYRHHLDESRASEDLTGGANPHD